jgi:addiction module HigA family antidote
LVSEFCSPLADLTIGGSDREEHEVRLSPSQDLGRRLRRESVTEYLVKTPPAWQPSHPGELLREDVLPALGLTVKGAAEKLGVSRQTLHAILSERAAVTPEMAARLGKLCGDGPAVWLRMQQARDLWRVERDMAEELARIPTLRAT